MQRPGLRAGPPRFVEVRRSALDAHCDTHAAADAQRREAFLGVALLHLVQEA
jgi:hypothetical protein